MAYIGHTCTTLPGDSVKCQRAFYWYPHVRFVVFCILMICLLYERATVVKLIKKQRYSEAKRYRLIDNSKGVRMNFFLVINHMLAISAVFEFLLFMMLTFFGCSDFSSTASFFIVPCACILIAVAFNLFIFITYMMMCFAKHFCKDVLAHAFVRIDMQPKQE
jgi:hypothetical protein